MTYTVSGGTLNLTPVIFNWGSAEPKGSAADQ